MSKNTSCKQCGEKLGGLFGSQDSGNGLCLQCDGKRRQAAYREMAQPALEKQSAEKAMLDAMIVTTESLVVNMDVVARHGIVSADVAYGQHAFKDMAIGLTDTFGGRSATLSKTLRESRATALDELKREAAALGANAVIAIEINITTVGYAGSMTLVSATGTAVTLKHLN